MEKNNNSFSKEELKEIDKTDDLKIAPFRADGITYGTPTWIWNVVVNDNLYVRAYNGVDSRWYQSAIKQKKGKIIAAGKEFNVKFESLSSESNEAIDDAYRKKYSNSPYLAPMIEKKTQQATIKIIKLSLLTR